MDIDGLSFIVGMLCGGGAMLLGVLIGLTRG